MKLNSILTWACDNGIDTRYLRVGSVEPGAYDKFCIVQNQNGWWETFHIERGPKEHLKVFRNESDAVDHFIEWISSFPDLRMPPSA